MCCKYSVSIQFLGTGFGLRSDLERLLASYVSLGGVPSSAFSSSYPSSGSSCLRQPLQVYTRNVIDLMELSRLLPLPQLFKNSNTNPIRNSFKANKNNKKKNGSNCSTVSLSKLSEIILGKRLDKSVQCSEWHARPLKPEQIQYAALDAAVLCAILATLIKNNNNKNNNNDSNGDGSGGALLNGVRDGSVDVVDEYEKSGDNVVAFQIDKYMSYLEDGRPRREGRSLYWLKRWEEGNGSIDELGNNSSNADGSFTYVDDHDFSTSIATSDASVSTWVFSSWWYGNNDVNFDDNGNDDVHNAEMRMKTEPASTIESIFYRDV